MVAQAVNRDVNPWLMEHGLAGSAKGEIAPSGTSAAPRARIYLTPVHPTVRGDEMFIPAPLGAGSQWARNVLHSGTAGRASRRRRCTSSTRLS